MNNNNNNNNKNFFQDMLDSAFANDPSLLRKQDKKDGSIDSALYSDDESENGYFTTAQENVIPTPTQQQWREAQAKLHQPGAPVQASSLFSNNNNNNKKHIQWRLDLYLSGVPSKDPSNDLYGARTNISTRSQQQGMDLPDDPTVTVLLQLDHDGVCRVMNDTPFATPHQTDHVGEWKLSENGRMLRFRIFVLGYSRTVQTRGTIAAVAWSEREEVSSRTSTTYDIPPGWIYGDVAVGYGARPGTVHMPERGVLRVEQTVGLLQVASKMVPCGQFEAKQVLEDDDVV